MNELIQSGVSSGSLRAVTKLEPSDVFIITVPTPFKDEDKTPDLSYVMNVCETICKVLKPGNLIILESTSPVGTTENIVKYLHNKRPDLNLPINNNNNADVGIAYCPERIMPGNAIYELVNNDRVIGGITESCAKAAAKIYNSFLKGSNTITSSKVAELTKLTENSYRDVNIAFANEISLICDQVDVDVWELIRCANKHPRVNILQPGPGVGGHCIAVDPWFIISQVPETAVLIQTARHVNDNKVIKTLNLIISKINSLKKEKNNKTISLSIYGISYKANVGDVRESPSITIIQGLINEFNVSINIYDPHVERLPKSLNSDNVVFNLEDDYKPDIAVLLVEHDEFKDIHHNFLDKTVTIDSKGFWN